MTNTLPKKDKKPVSTQGGLSNPRTSKPAPHMSSISKTGPMNYDGDSIDDTSSSSITSLTPSPASQAARQAAYMDKHLLNINSKVSHGKGGAHIGMSTVSLDDTSSDDSTYSSQTCFNVSMKIDKLHVNAKKHGYITTKASKYLQRRYNKNCYEPI